MTGALDGIRVIDFGQYIAGPLTGMFLADQGADVIRVDPPGGPRWDTPANATWNRGKRSIVLDLKAAGDLETARRLIATADVVIENFRPGGMERLGLGAPAMTAANTPLPAGPDRFELRRLPGRREHRHVPTGPRARWSRPAHRGAAVRRHVRDRGRPGAQCSSCGRCRWRAMGAVAVQGRPLGLRPARQPELSRLRASGGARGMGGGRPLRPRRAA